MDFKVSVLLVLLFTSACSSSDDEKQVIPSVNIANVEKVEGDDGILTVDFPVTLTESYTEDLIIKYTTEDGSAFQGSDYKKTSGQVTIPAGSTSVTIPLEIISDKIKEGRELFRVRFDSDAQVDWNKMSADIFIGNDDSALPYDTEDYITPNSYPGWKISWADEFVGPEINTDIWTHEIGNGDNGWGNQELEYYTDAPENSRIEDGKLVIEARNDSWNGKEYTSARMITWHKKSMHYGRVDIRAKLPTGQGIWPALWMLGDNLDTKGWPACGETDIMELIGNQPSTSHATVHFGANGTHSYFGKQYSLNGEIFNDRFHVFSLVWEFNQLWFYVDDILFYEFTSKETQGQPYPFNDPSFFLFNVAIGGQWPGDPDETTVFPQQMVVDYIRVFEKEQTL
jgi:beta-glucanase (GH16 family)